MGLYIVAEYFKWSCRVIHVLWVVLMDLLQSLCRYVYTDKLGKYILLKNYDSDYSCLSIHDLALGLTSAEHKEK